LSFWHWYEVTIYGVDGFYVEITDDGGENWTTYDFIGSGGALVNPLLPLGGEWLQAHYDMSSYSAGTAIQVRFRFVSDSEEVAEGLYIDDVRVESYYSHFVPVAKTEKGKPTPMDFCLSQNYPNPFNPKTYIQYNLAKPGKVTLKVYNLLGQEIETLVNGFQDAGNYRILLDASSYSSGIYFYQIKANGFSSTRKMCFLK
ncbi:T9SS type A sorting domain-containing protein, partial [candidate division KSB1 bacterium]|nr:T9SS type A sorting domain-containing protein [candidate division KSB1 bacterium]